MSDPKSKTLFASDKTSGAGCFQYLRPRFGVLFVGIMMLLTGQSPAADEPLLRFDHGFDVTKPVCSDAGATLVKVGNTSVLRVNTGQTELWPGIALAAPSGHWDLSAHGQIAVTLRNFGANPVVVNCRVDNPGADGTKNCVNGSIELKGGQTNNLKIALPRTSGSTLDGKLFGMRGYPAQEGGPGSVDVTNITQLLFFVNNPKEDHSFGIGNIRATGVYAPPTAWVTDADPYFPLIDTFGQYRHKEWPGKIHSIAELRERRKSEAVELAAHPGPSGWDKYGGWAKGPQLKATGYFRTQKVAGRWWLVDPAGRLFWSHGIDCVQALGATPVEERSTWFENFAGDLPDYREFLSTGHVLKGHYAGRNVSSFSFDAANLKRKYGMNWKADHAELIHRRLRSWGLNTIGNWSDSGVFLMRRTPYTDNVGSHGVKMIEGSEGYWGKFPDVFDPDFAAAINRAMAGKQTSSANDPWCIGYFSDNEMSWGDDTSLALGALKSPATQAAKLAMIADLKTKYGDIAKLNSAWGGAHPSWDDLLQSRAEPDRAKARADLAAFSIKTAETYFRLVRDAIKSVAPQQLYLGCRFSSVNDLAARAAGKYCDVLSYNLYQRDIADFTYPGGGKPFLIGEFHFGALDRGMFHTGLGPVANQAARARAYRDYVLGGLRNPLCVGTHWFQWQDEPTTGRVYDEENYQIGFVDVADTPYPETIGASRDAGARLYRKP